MEIAHQHVLITGSNRGIGLALAKAMSTEKAHLHLVMRKKQTELITELKNLGADSVEIYEADLGTFEQIEKLVSQLKQANVEPDILINNAGLLTGGLLENQKIEDIYSMMSVNVLATIHLTHRLLPLMLKRKTGKIVNNASVSGVMHFPLASTYTASKSAIVAFTTCLKQELRGTGLSTLLLLTPGIKTRMFDEIEEIFSPQFNTSFLQSIEPEAWAEQVKEAILHDVTTLRPSGWAGTGLKVARHVPQLFEWLVRKKFHR